MKIRRTTSIEREPARLREALPWYSNATLEESDRAWVEQALAGGDARLLEELREELEFDRQLAEAFDRKLAEVPADVGWAGLLQQVRTDAAREVGERAGERIGERTGGGSTGGGSWLERLGRMFSPGLSPRLGMAMAVLVAVQAVAIGVLLGERGTGAPDTVEYRAGAGAAPVTAIRALLNDSITERALRQSLSANGATIVDGPNPLGEYWLVTERDPEAVANALRDAGIIATYVIDQRTTGR